MISSILHTVILLFPIERLHLTALHLHTLTLNWVQRSAFNGNTINFETTKRGKWKFHYLNGDKFSWLYFTLLFTSFIILIRFYYWHALMTNFSAHMFSRGKKVMLTNLRQCNLYGIFSVHVSHLIVFHKTHVTTKTHSFKLFWTL